MSFYKESIEFYKGLKTSDLMKTKNCDPILIGESFLAEEYDLRTFLPEYGIPNFIAITAKVVDLLGSGVMFKTNFDSQTGLNDGEVKDLENQGFDGNFAKAVVHLALYRYKGSENESFGKIHKGLINHLDNAYKNIKYSSASDSLKLRLKIILFTLSVKHKKG